MHIYMCKSNTPTYTYDNYKQHIPHASVHTSLIRKHLHIYSHVL